jgi:hypothetical protein
MLINAPNLCAFDAGFLDVFLGKKKGSNKMGLNERNELVCLHVVIS